jgi:hypothetical protein
VKRSATCGKGNIHRTSLRRGLTRLPQLCAWLLFLTLVMLAPTLHAETLVVIVNPSNPVQILNRRQALEIFAGHYRSFPNGLAALPIDLDAYSSERREFYLTLAHKEPPEMASYWARATFSGHQTPPFQVSNAKTALDMVATNPSAIAYVYREAVDSRVRVVLELTP